jgi:hypothetical protein
MKCGPQRVVPLRAEGPHPPMEGKDMGTKSTLARSLVGATLALACSTVSAVAVAPPAAAETLNGSCESGEVCLYWSFYYSGPIADMYDNVADYGPWHFAASSHWLNDNTWSGKSRSVWQWACVSEHSNYGGKMFWKGAVDQGDNPDFGAWRNKASSHRFLLICSYN